MSMNWQFASMFSLISFGFWGFWGRLAVDHLTPKSAFLLQVFGTLLVGLFLFRASEFNHGISFKGLTYGILTGTAYALGCLYFLMAVNKGQAGVVVTVTGLYPMVTLLLAWVLLHESLTIKQCCGLFFAIIAMVLFAS